MEKPQSRRKRSVKAKSPAMALHAQTAEAIEVFPSGISVSSELGRPVLILRDKSGVEVLPVWMNPLDAGVAMAELSHGAGTTPHSVARRVMEMMSLRLESCHFVELQGHHQFVELGFRGIDGMKSMRVRADAAMSFCIQAHARFYSTKEYMARCRDLDEDLTKFENNLARGELPGLQSELENSSKKHPYVM